MDPADAGPDQTEVGMDEFQIGAVVVGRDGRVGVVIDCWPMQDAAGGTVRWEPLLSGEVTRLTPDEVTVVTLDERRTVLG